MKHFKFLAMAIAITTPGCVLTSCASDTPITVGASYQTKDGQIISVDITGTPKQKPAVPTAVTVTKPSGATTSAPLVSTTEATPPAAPVVTPTK
ncbi:MAG: hypothetical protein QM755_16705 [Luteolibacter sp.]